MKQIRVHTYDYYTVEITDEEFEQLKNGDIDITELMGEKHSTEECVWRNGGTEWE